MFDFGNDFLLSRIIFMVPLILSLTVHEWAHAWAAWRLGDDTAKLLGRMTLNPIAHIDPVGTLLLPMIGIPFGWAKPVPVNPSRFNRRVSMPTGMMLTAAAGPVSNLMLALIVGCLLAVLSRFAPTVLSQSRYLNSMLEFLILLNVLLAVFNCLPIYPLDGSRIAEAFVPVKWRAHWVSYVRWCPVLLAGVILLPFLSGISIFEWPINKTLELIDWLSG